MSTPLTPVLDIRVPKKVLQDAYPDCVALKPANEV